MQVYVYFLCQLYPRTLEREMRCIAARSKSFVPCPRISRKDRVVRQARYVQAGGPEVNRRTCDSEYCGAIHLYSL